MTLGGQKDAIARAASATETPAGQRRNGRCGRGGPGLPIGKLGPDDSIASGVSVCEVGRMRDPLGAASQRRIGTLA